MIDIEFSKNLISFLKDHKEALTKNDFFEIYFRAALAVGKELDPSDVGTLTQFFYNHGFDPLQELLPLHKDTPPYYLAHTKEYFHLEIPEGFETINAHTAPRSDLRAITIPSTLKRIVTKAFTGCKSLCVLIYPGTKEEFRKITIEPDAFKGCTNLKFIQCKGVLEDL